MESDWSCEVWSRLQPWLCQGKYSVIPLASVKVAWLYRGVSELGLLALCSPSSFCWSQVMYLLWMMEPGPISHPEVFFEVLFCPDFQSRAMGRPSMHSLYWLHYSEQSPEAVVPLSLPVCGLGTWSPSCCHSSPLTLMCYCTDSVCNYFALTEKMKIVIKPTDTCSWCDLSIWGKGLVLHLSSCLALFCLLSSIRENPQLPGAALHLHDWEIRNGPVRCRITPQDEKQLLSLKQIQEMWTKRQNKETQVLLKE